MLLIQNQKEWDFLLSNHSSRNSVICGLIFLLYLTQYMLQVKKKKTFISYSYYCHQTNSNNWLQTYLSISVGGTKIKTSELPLLLFSEICSVSCDIKQEIGPCVVHHHYWLTYVLGTYKCALIQKRIIFDNECILDTFLGKICIFNERI